MDRHGISGIMIGFLDISGHDNYGKVKGEKTVPVLENILSPSQSPASRLLQLPLEILADVAMWLSDDKLALASLALVNSECRQWARSIQFAQVCFDYSPSSQQLVQHLAREIKTNDGRSKIGPCIRRFTFVPSRDCIVAQHPKLYEAKFGRRRSSSSHARLTLMEDEASEYYKKCYRDVLSAIIPDAMPNLDTVIWKDEYVIADGSLLSALVNTPKLQNLKIDGVPIAIPIVLDVKGKSTWPLRSLFLEARVTSDRFDRVHHGEGNRADIDACIQEYSDMVTSIFQLCAPTLERLRWHWRYNKMQFGSKFLFGGQPEFLRLRQFRCDIEIDPRTLASILKSPLRELELGCESDKHFRALCPVLDACEPLLDLETFVLWGLKSDHAVTVCRFLAKNKQLKKFSVGPATQDTNQQLINVLSTGNFSNLTSLSMHWGGPEWKVSDSEASDPEVSDSEDHQHVVSILSKALAGIGTLTSLYQLRLEASLHRGTRWLIDHDLLRTHLRGLKNLNSLALCEDGYNQDDSTDHRSYYTSQKIIRQDMLRQRGMDLALLETTWRRADPIRVGDNSDLFDHMRHDEKWELGHRNFILTEAEKYAAVLPSLKRLYAGQLPMAIRVPGDGSLGNAVPLSEKRCTGRAALGYMFMIDE